MHECTVDASRFGGEKAHAIAVPACLHQHLMCAVTCCLRHAFCVQDLSDVQWREFRAGMPALAALLAAAAALSRLLQRRGASPRARARFYLLFSLAFLGEAVSWQAVYCPAPTRNAVDLAQSLGCSSTPRPHLQRPPRHRSCHPACLGLLRLQATCTARARCWCWARRWPASAWRRRRQGGPMGELHHCSFSDNLLIWWPACSSCNC